MAGKPKLTAREAFDDNLADAEKLVEVVRAFQNQRAYRMRRERRESVGQALKLTQADSLKLDWIEGEELYLILKPGSSFSRDSFSESEMRPLLRQAIVAACAAVETFVADRAKERLGSALKYKPLPPRLAGLPMTVGDWREIETHYKKRGWGIRNVLEPEIERSASASPSEIGKLMSIVGVEKGLWRRVNKRLGARSGRAEETLERIVERRNKITHTGDRKGRGRATITLEEVEDDLKAVREIVEALDDEIAP